MGLIMQNTPEPGSAVSDGLRNFKRLEALDLLPLPICLRSGVSVDVEHASDYEFTCWLRWNGIPFTGLTTWTFDNRCAVINHALRNGVKPRLVSVPPERCLRTVCELFVFPQPAPQDDGDDPPPNSAA